MKTAEIWEQIFNDYNILDVINKQGYFEITSEEISKYHEARLMAKYDFSKSRPRIFKDNNLGILPVKRGKYIIGHFELYHKLEKIEKEPIPVCIPSYIETIDPDNIYSETNALHVGLLSGMFEDIADGEVVQSISGRMCVDSFSFDIDLINSDEKMRIDVSNPMIEIDGGYENYNNVILVEAKNRKTDDFIIRQLYYPFRYWKDKIKKPILPLFFVYDSGIYTIYKYDFKDPNNYNSLNLVEANNYKVYFNNSNKHLKNIFETIKNCNEPHDIPFPQADSFTRVLNTVMLLFESNCTAKDIAEKLEVVDRQGYYYLDAAKYLGFIDKAEKRGYYKPSDKAYKIFRLETKLRNKKIAELILEHKPFYETLKIYFSNNEKMPNKEEIRLILYNFSNIKNMGSTDDKVQETINRRTSTLISWLSWILNSNL